MGAFDTSYNDLAGPLDLAQPQRKARPAIPSAPDPATQGDSVKSPVRMPTIPGQATGMNYSDVQGAIIGQKPKPAPIAPANPMAGITGTLAAPTAPAPAPAAAATVQAPAAAAQAAQAAPANLLNSLIPNISIGRSPPPTIFNNGGLPADVQQRNIATMQGQLASPATTPAASQAVNSTPTDPDALQAKGGNILGMITGAYADQAKMLGSAVANAIPTPFDNRAESRRQANRAELGGVTPADKATAPTVAVSPPTATVSPSSQAQIQPAAPAAKAGFNANGVATAESVNAATGGAGNAVNLVGANEAMAKTNAMRQAMIDNDAKPSWQDQYGDRDPYKEEQAAKQALSDKWDRENAQKEAMRAIERNPKSANAIAALVAANGHDTTNMAGQSLAAGTAASRDQTIRRGQNMEAKAEAAKLAGNPMENLLKQTQAETGQIANARTTAQGKHIEAINAEKDPAKRNAMIESLLASQGKNVSEHRYVKVEGGETIGPDGFTKVKQPSGVFDSVTKQFIPMTATGQSQQAAPHGEGTKLLGKDGKQYIVQNGVPVLAK